MPKSSIQLVAFDLDGTLVHAFRAVAHSINASLTHFGLPEESYLKIKRSVGWGEGHLLKTFVGPERVEEALDVYRGHHARALRERGGVRFLPGVKSTLTFLKKQGVQLSVATNRPSRFTHIILEELGLQDIFSFVICADEVKQAKPHPEMLLTTLKHFQCPKEHAFYVGDMTVDAETGKAAGVRVVSVMTGSSSWDEVAALKPYRMIKRMTDLKGVV